MLVRLASKVEMFSPEQRTKKPLESLAGFKLSTVSL